MQNTQKQSSTIPSDSIPSLTPAQRVEQSAQFLRELGRGIPSDERVMAGYAEEATVQTDAKGKKINGGWWPVPYKDGKYIDANKNCYVCISSSIKTPNSKTGEMRYWRGEASFGHGLALMVDDIGSGAGSKGGLTLEHFEAILPPTVVVETSPGNYQLWYFLDQPEPEMRYFKGFLTSFVAAVLKTGGDNTIKDVSRYGRMPCGINNKRHSPTEPYKYLVNGKPFVVQLVEAHYDRRYSIEQIAEAFRFEVIVPQQKAPEEFNPDEYKADSYWLMLARHLMSGQGEGAAGAVSENMSGKTRIQCPWSENHKNGDTFGAYFRGPIQGADVDFVFGCAHDSCRKTYKGDGTEYVYAVKRQWHHFVDKIVMPYIEAKLDEANKFYSEQ